MFKRFYKLCPLISVCYVCFSIEGVIGLAIVIRDVTIIFLAKLWLFNHFIWFTNFKKNPSNLFLGYFLKFISLSFTNLNFDLIRRIKVGSNCRAYRGARSGF